MQIYTFFLKYEINMIHSLPKHATYDTDFFNKNRGKNKKKRRKMKQTIVK